MTQEAVIRKLNIELDICIAEAERTRQSAMQGYDETLAAYFDGKAHGLKLAKEMVNDAKIHGHS